MSEEVAVNRSAEKEMTGMSSSKRWWAAETHTWKSLRRPSG